MVHDHRNDNYKLAAMSSPYECMIDWVSLIMNRDTPWKNLYLWIAGIVSLFTFITNPLMIYGICKTSHDFTVANKLYVAFGVFNFIATLNVFVIHVLSVVKQIEELTLKACNRLNMVFIFLTMILDMLLMIILLMVTSLQYIAITNPLHNKDIEHTCFGGPWRKALWVFGLLLLTVVYATVTIVMENKLVMVVAPILGILVVVINFYLIYHLNNLARGIRCTTTNRSNQGQTYHKHAVVTLLLITGALIVFNLPNTVLIYYINFKEENNIKDFISNLRIAEWAALFSVISRGIYPFIYVVRNRTINSFYRERMAARRGTDVSTGSVTSIVSTMLDRRRSNALP